MNTRESFIILLVIGVILIAGDLYFFCKRINSRNEQISNNQPMSETTTYINQKAGYQIDYPKDFPISYAKSERTVGSDVFFAFPESFTKGTNLSTDSAIKVEVIQAVSCGAASFFGDQDRTSVKLYDIDHPNFSSKGESLGAAAGNRYEKIVYTESNLGICYGVQLFLHSTNIGNYPEGTVKEFDRTKVDEVFNKMLLSFKISRSNI